MATAIVTTATTLEGQMLELATKGQLEEVEYNDANPNNTVNRITISPNIEAGTVNISIDLPITITSSGNTLVVSAAPYLP